MKNKLNIDLKTVEGFGDEWERFDQSELTEKERKEIFEKYFSIFPWDKLTDSSEGFDLGCGSGRWACMVAPRVGRLHCIEPSVALEVARKNLKDFKHCEFHNSTVDVMPIENGSMDFGYSLGVLHHVPDTQAGIDSCVKKLKPGAPFLVYLYYSFDNKPWWFRCLWLLSDIFRKIVSRLPHSSRYLVSQVFALFIYWPLARFSWIAEKASIKVDNIPLSAYRSLSLYTMRTDALDRFGTRLEQRFSRHQIRSMMENAGLEKIVFSENVPFWCAVGYRSLKVESN
jgi:ubiquinone/menaquinone biosynthesis C-methylase UbiE